MRIRPLRGLLTVAVLTLTTLPLAVGSASASPVRTATAADPIGDAQLAAATALRGQYNTGTGLWPSTGWWNAANAVTALADTDLRNGTHTYDDVLANTFEANKSAQGGNFTNNYLDDTGWWGLAWVRAFDRTGQQHYLDMARVDADYMYSYRDDTCGGGVWWNTDKKYKNAITNELFLKLTAALHNRISGDTTYLARARQEWQWFSGSGMINGSHLVNDGLDTASCKNNGQTTWTYNQGVILGGLVELHRATGDAGLLSTAEQIGDAATDSATLNPGGILTEPCESGDCGGDGPSFKGIFARNLGELSQATGGRYQSYLTRQADSAIAHDRNGSNQYGLHWAGPFDRADAARQHSALDLLTAARG